MKPEDFNKFSAQSFGSSLSNQYVKKAVSIDLDKSYKNLKEKNEQAHQCIKRASYVTMACAFVGTPVDNFMVFQVIQQIMAHRIARIYGYPLEEAGIGQILLHGLSVFGMGFLGNMAYQTVKHADVFGEVVPLIGELVPSGARLATAFGVTYGIGKTVAMGYECKASDKKVLDFIGDKFQETKESWKAGKYGKIFEEEKAKLKPNDIVDIFGRKFESGIVKG